MRLLLVEDTERLRQLLIESIHVAGWRVDAFARADDAAQANHVGASGLPLPRFASIRSQPVNIRVGPSRDHNVAWTFTHAGVPVEITQEYDIWFRVRDSEGQEGWLQKTMLSGKRTAFVIPWEKSGNVALHSQAAAAGPVMAYMEPGVIVDVTSCDGKWCKVTVSGYKGYMEQVKLWGVYPDETFD